MKAFKFTPLRSIYILFSFIATTTAALADGPNIITPNPNTATAELGSAFGPYQIVTDQDGSGSPDAPVLYNAQGLPPGLLCDAFTGEITGTPTVSSLVPFTVTLSATDDNDFTGTEGTLLITVNDPAFPPAITSALAITAPAGDLYEYTITASNNPISFSVVGLSAMETVGSPSINPLTGSFSFTPSDSGVGDSINLIIKATYEDGSFVREILRVTISAAATTATIPDTITVDPNLSGSQFDPKQTSTIYVSADVTPATGATISSVVAVWTNPSNPEGTPLDPIILAELVGPAAGGGFSGTINIGFDPLNRELGGGNIDLELRAYQINAVDSADFLSRNVSFEVAPLLDVFVPDDNLLRSALDIGDEFAGARVNTNEFGTVTAFISGPGIVESLTVSSPTSDGIYFFATPQEISFPGIYQVRVEVTDNLGLSAVIERELFITETLGEPVAAITAPLPGFTNEVFSAAVISYSQSGAPEPVTIGSGATTTIIGYNITYALNLVSAGQGYYPRNGTTSAPVTATVTGGTTADVRNITGIGFSNGRVDSLPATTTHFFTEDYDDDDDPTTPGVREPRWITPGNAILDDLRDPGTSGKITITGQFFRANAPLDSFEISVNGEEYLSGNLNPSLGVGTLITGEEYEILTAGTTDFTLLGAANNDPGTTFTYNGTPVAGTGTIVGEIDVPIFDFPADGSPDPGDYVVTAQVIDQEGKVGNAFPVSFQILPYEPLSILLSRQVAAGTAPNDPVPVGSSATFLADINPINEIESVEFFESTSGVKLGDGSRVQIGGQEFYRCAIIFPEAGDFEVYAFATGFNGQTVNSSPIEITVESGEFPEVSITAPLLNSDVPAGENLEILINANDPDGQITVVEVFNGSTTNPDNLLGLATPTGSAGQYRLNFTPTVADAGVINLIARATDDLGNSTDSDVAQVGVVLGAVPVIEILSPAVEGAEFFVGQPFEIRARITDASPGGSITSATLTDVIFYTRVEGVNGTILVVNDSISFSPQIDVMSQSSTPDEYVYMATINSPDVVGMVITATDNSGNVTKSAPFEFTVTNGVVPDVVITAANSTVLGEVSVEPLIAGVEYKILTVGTTDFATLGPVPVNEDSLVTGQTYQIVTEGTDFTTAGAPSNAVGTVFVAGPNASTGSTGAAIDISVGTVFTSNGTPGAGTGTVLRSSANATHSNVIAVEPLIAGVEYEILTLGDTDFATLSVDPDPVFDVGTLFRHTGAPGAGTGTVRVSGAIPADLASVVTLIINASDGDDSVSQVEVLSNGLPLGFANLVRVDYSDNPILKTYRFDHYSSSAGLLNFQARATDNYGNTGLSNLAKVAVVSGAIPTAVITSPADGSSITAGKNIEILVTAEDIDGQVTSVLGYANGLPIVDPQTGEILYARPTGIANEYLLSYPSSVDLPGNINLEARVTDNQGNVGLSEIVPLNVVLGAVPQIEILSPQPGDQFLTNQPFAIRARITDADGTITSATFARDQQLRTERQIDNNGVIRLVIIEASRSFNGDEVMVATATADEYQFIATLDTPDLVGLQIKATDDDGNETVSREVQFTVTNGSAPDVAIAAPLGKVSVDALIAGEQYEILTVGTGTGTTDFIALGAANSDVGTIFIYNGAPGAGDGTSRPVYDRGDIVVIDIDASDGDGSISEVKVFNGSTEIGTANIVSNGKYRYNYTANAVGRINLNVQAMDDLGNPAISNIETITIVTGDIPAVGITLPGGTSYTAGDIITIDVDADDADGSVTSVEIFNGDVSLGTASKVSAGAVDYRFNLQTSLTDLGDLQLNARATDDSGNVSISTFVVAKVVTGAVPTVTIMSPAGGLSYTAGDIITIDVDADDADGSVTSVEIFNGDVSLGTASKVSAGAVDYRFNLQTSLTDLGDLQLNARATDDSGNVSISTFVEAQVVTGAIPTVTIDSPSAVSIFNYGDVIPFEITASDLDGSISSVSVSDSNNGTPTALGQALKIDSVSGDQYRYSLNTAVLTAAGTKFISVSAVDNSGNVSTDVVEIRLDVVPFSVNFVTQTVTNTATNTITTPTASPYVIEGAIGEYSSASRPFTVEIGGIDPSTLKSLDWQLQLDDGSAPVSVSETLVATAEGNGQTTEENGQEGSVAASLIYTQSFEFSSAGTLTVTATNTSDVVVQNSLTVFIDLPEPVTDLTDFINYIYNQVQGAVPSAVGVGTLVNGEKYEIVTVGTTNFASLGPVPVNEDSLVAGQTYQIVTEGTDFTTAGAPSNAVGTVFTAGPIASTGSTGTAIDISVGTVFTSNGTAGSGTGTVRSEVIAAIDAINILGGDTPANRAAFAATLFPSDQYNDSRYQTVALVYKTLTGQWPNQAQLETGLSTILQDTAAESNQTTVPLSGSITAGSTQILNFNYSQGDQVTITVTGDGTNGNPLTDATLTVSAPDGSFVGYSDDNFLSGNFSLDPVVSFVASQTGAYTVTVGGYNSFQSGDFVATSTSTAIESNTEILSARALVESLKGAYNGANGFLADAATTSLLSPAFVAQIYLNKHGVGITAQNAAILGSRLIGDDVTIGTGDILSGYQSNVVNFVADFARDVDLVAYGPYASATTDEGYHYTGNLYYGRPNNPLPSWYQARAEIQSDANLNSALSAFLGIQNPTAADLAPYAGITFEEALALIFASAEFDVQFAGDTANSDTDGDGFSNYQEVLLGTDPDDGSVAPSAVDLQVALYMLSLGVDDGDKVALDDDADADGVSNYAEILLNTDPSDGSVAPTTADSFVAQRMIDLGVVDPSLVSASDDADGDGVSNYAEILLDTDPSDGSVEPTADDSIVAQEMIDLGVVDPTLIAPDDDADGDGVSNYAEILLITDPSDGTDAPTAVDSFVAQRMIDLGVVDGDKVAAEDDADGDGVSNIAEILLNTNPSNTNDEPTASGSSSIEGTDFVFEFVRLKSSLTPIGASVVVECADETFTFAPVSAVDLQTNLSLSADQTGIPSDYERFEYRVDTSSIGCNFFRLLVQ